MARRNPRTPTMTARFPRPRGDGPAADIIEQRGTEFSPPTRGWPAGCGCRIACATVFPAHAGMARYSQTSSQLHMRFPRPRGDGPPCKDLREIIRRFSPPTRGWPEIAGLAALVDDVFPAHAGMARCGSGRCGAGWCFPRPRGDGPADMIALRRIVAFSPPTRGWPAWRPPVFAAPRVFPAHAGMARTLPRGRCWLRRFPRPRGDGPRCILPMVFSK